MKKSSNKGNGNIENLSDRILDHILTGIWAVDENDLIVYFNHAMEKISGISKEEIIGSKIMNYIDENVLQDEGHFREMFLRAKYSREITRYRAIPMTTPAGNLIYQSGVLIPLIGDTGNYTGMIGTVEDVTGQDLEEQITKVKPETEKTLESIYRNSPVVAFLWSAEKDWPVKYVSENISQFGYRPDEFTSGKLLYGDIIHPEDVKKVRSDISRIEIEDQMYFTKEYRILTKQSDIRWVTERSMLVRNRHGEPVYYQGIIIDITERKLAEEALKDSEKKYRLIFENSPLGIFHFDSNGVVTHCNEKLADILGISKDEIIGFDMIRSLKDESMRKAFEAVFSRKPGHYEGYYQAVTGSKYTPIKADFSPNIAEDGSLLGGVGIIGDISERKKAEDALRASEQKYSSLVEKSNDGIVILQDYILKFANNKMAEILGYSKEEITGKSMSSFIPEKYRDMVLERYEKRIKKDPNIPNKYEIELISKSGEYVPVEINASFIEHEDRPADMAIIRDITERKKAEEELKKYTEELARANEELKSLDKMKDEFLSNVSHELKTPLVSIKGYAEILYEETVGTLNNGQKNSLAKIVRNSERLMRMVNSLLFISAAEGEGVEYKSEKVNIQILIDEVIEDISLQAKSKNMKIEKKVSSDLPPVFGDKEKLADMLINILDNSLKFTPEEGKISISASEDKGSLHIIISDSGIGIPDELIPYLFKKFYQVDASIRRKYGGTGLGLYICKNIVEAHGGKMWIESVEGVGTTVHVMLPGNSR
ncbi:PAS/PAC sensor signal transduction histidine kinase [Methanosalsum zhilinae DSM 4017]|uniref:histidine kinase n=1 Tax=Methanosalsum zhilinae (strain DSM 4017 / NBRC 107636 / OCM 62 / WeN5) TaxID=679901 RepID=F7XL98_METZD|nr:PAS domain S-box protein [Methanosalsum zhilinae]AEH60755.1 PAS/PAC sensor signal transduction histidine kinase [Methanosalsum zhilinae DSM 4017]